LLNYDNGNEWWRAGDSGAVWSTLGDGVGNFQSGSSSDNDSVGGGRCRDSSKQQLSVGCFSLIGRQAHAWGSMVAQFDA
jgi:hypothetical protein